MSLQIRVVSGENNTLAAERREGDGLVGPGCELLINGQRVAVEASFDYFGRSYRCDDRPLQRDVVYVGRSWFHPRGESVRVRPAARVVRIPPTAVVEVAFVARLAEIIPAA